MDALTARALLFQRKLSIEPVPFSIPGVPELDNQLSIIELGEDAVTHCNELAKLPDESVSNKLAVAAMVVKSLVLTETKERLCSDTDVEFVATWGHSILGPLQELISKVSCLSKTSLEDAKKNCPLTPANVSATSSPESSAEVAPSLS